MRGKLVTLRPIVKEDSDCYFRWINNKALVLKNADYRPISKIEHISWFNSLSLKTNMVIFSIVKNENNKLIGTCSLRNIDLNHKNAELQIRIGEVIYHGQGLGSEAVCLLLKHGFSYLNLKRIYLHVFCNNIRAIKAYEKCGFCLEGVLRKAACIEGKFIDVKVMSIINEDYI